MQVGVVITQNNRPIAFFFSRKLFEMQTKYSVSKIELLAIVETLKGFGGMLWGQHIKVYNNHMHIIRWGLHWRISCHEIKNTRPCSMYAKKLERMNKPHLTHSAKLQIFDLNTLSQY